MVILQFPSLFLFIEGVILSPAGWGPRKGYFTVGTSLQSCTKALRFETINHISNCLCTLPLSSWFSTWENFIQSALWLISLTLHSILHRLYLSVHTQHLWLKYLSFSKIEKNITSFFHILKACRLVEEDMNPPSQDSTMSCVGLRVKYSCRPLAHEILVGIRANLPNCRWNSVG